MAARVSRIGVIGVKSLFNQPFSLTCNGSAVRWAGTATSTTSTSERWSVHEPREIQKNNFCSSLSTTEILRSILVGRLCSNGAFVRSASKLHGLTRTALGSGLTNKLLKGIIFRQFVAGETKPELDAVVQRFATHGVNAMILPPMEDLSEDLSQRMLDMCNRNCTKFLEFVDLTHQISLETSQKAVLQLKLSSVISTPAMNALSSVISPTKPSLMETGRKIGEYLKNPSKPLSLHLDDPILGALQEGIILAKKIFQRAQELDVPILIDAELKDAHLAMYTVYLGIGTVFCQECPNVYVTYQCYMKDIPPLLQLCQQAAHDMNQCFAAKLVRGAYLEQEKAIAKQRGLEDPIWPSIEATSKAYNGAVDFMLQQVAANPGRVAVCIGTHNILSVENAKQRMRELRLKQDNPQVIIAQILGMCELLSSSLAQEGYRVYKSIAHGNANEWIPYLVRRASENHTAMMSARNELTAYQSELKRRLLQERRHQSA